MTFEDQFAQVDAVSIEDFDGDGYQETVLLDETGDGIADTAVTTDIETGNHSVLQVADDGSSVSLVYDSEGYVIEAAFVEADGSVLEMSGDGLTDFLAEFGAYTGSEVPVEVDVPVEEVEVYTEETYPEGTYPQESVSQVPIQTDPEQYTSVDEVTESESYEAWMAGLDPDGDGVIGDVSDADFWFEQSTGYTCGPSAVTQIIEDFTGMELPNEIDVSVYAASQGLLDGEGMSVDAVSQVLTDLGVPAETLHGQDWDDLAGYLAEGRSVVMAVDSGDYWPDTDDGLEVADHAVRIVAIDTERGVAILSDSGKADGHQLEVPLEVMDDAWTVEAGVDENGEVLYDRSLVVSDAVDPTADATSDPYAEPVIDEDQGDSMPDIAEDPFAESPVQSPTQSPVGTALDGVAGLDLAGTEDEGFVEKVFSNPLGWVIVPVTLAAARIFGSLGSKNK